MRILVVEDERKVAEFIRRGLEEDGYVVDVALDGDEGYFRASTNDYDLLLLDVMLPRLNGVDLCSKLRADKLEIPILMLTAKDGVMDKVKGLDAGADDYLTKPFAFEELSARVRALLRKHSLYRNSTKLQLADLAMDTVSHTVSRCGADIALSTKEYALLEYLLRNAGTVVTRTMIAEHVWDINFDSFSNVIDVYINYLRNKIDRGHPVKLIHTVRGRGYMCSDQSE